MNRGNMRLGALLVAVILIVIVVALIVGGGDDDNGGSGSSGGESIAATVVSADEISQRASEKGTPIYWAGPQDGGGLELSVPEEGRTYVRYLAAGAPAGDLQPALTVGTYAFAEPIPALEELAAKPGGVERSGPGGAVIYFNRDIPSSVYVAYPGVEAQIEVYDPDPQRAKELATAGSIVPIK